MLARLPEIIDPLGFAERRIELNGTLDLDGFSRLEELLLDKTGKVNVALFFSKEGRYSLIKGSVSTVLCMQCQHCLEKVEVPILSQIKLGVVTTLEQADWLPEGYEPFLLTEEKVLLKDIVEDELILAVPPFPRHQHACIAFNTNSLDLTSPVEAEPITNLKNPFAVLAKLKTTGDN